MAIWILTAVAGGLISILGFFALVNRYRAGEIRPRYLFAVAVGWSALASYAVLSALIPFSVDSLVTLFLLLPAFVAIVVIVREHSSNVRHSVRGRAKYGDQSE